MAVNTLKEYLVALGFKVDEQGLKRFDNLLNTTEKTATKFATSMLALATAVEVSVDKVTTKFTDLFYASQQLSASVENIDAFVFASNQIGVSASAAQASVAGFANAMRMNPGVTSLVSQFIGKDVTRLDKVEAYLDVVRKLKSLYGTEQGFALGGRIGSTFGIDPTTLRQDELNLDELTRKFEEQKRATKDAGLNQTEAARASKDFTNEMDKLEKRLGTLVELFDVRLLPVLTKFVQYAEKAVDWLTKMDTKTGGLSTDVLAVAGAFGAWNAAALVLRTTLISLGLIGGGAFTGGPLLGLLSRLFPAAALATANVAGAELLKSKIESDNASGTGLIPTLRNDLKPYGGVRGAWDKLKRRLLPGSYIRDRFQALGWTRAQASGIAANILAESGGDSGAFNPAGGGQGAFGIGQWRGARIDALKAFAAQRGMSHKDLDTQLAFYDYELRHGQGGDALGRTGTASDAASAVLRLFERPSAGGLPAQLSKRALSATDIFNQHSYSTPSSGGANVSISQKTDIHVMGGDAASTASAVASEQGRVNGDMVRNFAGAVN